MFVPVIQTKTEMKRIVLISVIASAFCCLNVNAQKAFRPMSMMDYNIWGEEFNRLFDTEAEVNFMFAPFHSGSPALSLNNGTIKVVTGEKEYLKECDSELYSSLVFLAKHSVMTANYYTNQNYGLDGITFFLFYKSDGVHSWQPRGLCRQTVDVFWNVMHAVEADDNALLEQQKAIADSACKIFKSYYPEDFVDISIYKSSFSSDPFNVRLRLFSVTELSDFKRTDLQLTFNFKRLKYRRSYKQDYLRKYEKTLQQVANWMYVQSDFGDISNAVHFIVADVTEPIIGKNQYGTYEIKINEKDITVDKMVSLIQQL